MEPSAGELIVVLAKTGRLPAWQDLSDTRRRAAEREHVELMLSVAREHGMLGIEGFRLVTAQQPWVRWWTIEFPTLAGAEAWIRAEMAPPYGAYGFCDYQLARRHAQNILADWAPNPRPSLVVPPGTDPRITPELTVDRSSVVVLLWGRWLPEALVTTPEQRGDEEHNALMRAVAREHGMIRIDAFAALSPQADWHRAWIMEFPTFEGAEAWLEAEVLPPHGRYSEKRYMLARRWAPEHFAAWTAWAQRSG